MVLPINHYVKAQLPFLPSDKGLPIVQPTRNITNSMAQSSNSTSVVGPHFLIPAAKAQTNMTALGEQVMLNTTALTNLSNDLNTGNLTPDDLKNQKAICAYENKTNVAAAILTGCAH